MRGTVPASATEVFKKDRRELPGGIMIKRHVRLRIRFDTILSYRLVGGIDVGSAHPWRLCLCNGMGIALANPKQ